MQIHGPEAQADTFAPEQLNPLLAQHGALLLRGLFAKPLIARLQQAVADAYLAADACFEKGDMPTEFYQRLYRYGHVRRSQIADYKAIEAELMGTVRLQQILRARYGQKVMLLQQNTLPRRQMPTQPERAIALHQDQEFVGALRSGLNLWIPLTSAGGSSPGLEVWLDHLQVPLLDLSMPESLRTQIIAQIQPRRRWRPYLEPGDVLLLSFFTLHQTWITPDMTQARLSHELRLASAEETALSTSLLSPYALV